MRDLIVIGGGPAGLIAAIEAAAAGLDVAVLEPKRGPIDKACGEGLLPGVRAKLAARGVDLRGYPFGGIVYQDHRVVTRRAEGRFREGSGLGVRRTSLHDGLMQRAGELGVDLIEERAERLVPGHDSVEVNAHRARYVVGADGLHSWTRRSLGIELKRRRRPKRFGVRQHFDCAPWADSVVVYWGPDFEAYVTPVSATSVGVAFLCEPPARFEALLARCPLLAERLAGCSPVSDPRGAGPFEVDPQRRQLGRVMLIGDAAGYVDPLTGEGIALGLATACEAVGCVLEDRPERYGRRWLRSTRRSRWMTEGLIALTQYRWPRRALIPALTAAPLAFDVALGLFDP